MRTINSLHFGALAMLLLAALSVSFVACSSDEYYEQDDDLTLASRKTRTGVEQPTTIFKVGGCGGIDLTQFNLCTSVRYTPRIKWPEFTYNEYENYSSNVSACEPHSISPTGQNGEFNYATINFPANRVLAGIQDTTIQNVVNIDAKINELDVRWNYINAPSSNGSFYVKTTGSLHVECEYTLVFVVENNRQRDTLGPIVLRHQYEQSIGGIDAKLLSN